MAQRSNKGLLPTQTKDSDDFIVELKRFHTHRGTPIPRIPQIGGRLIDLYRLYRRVIGLGGWKKINEEQRWDEVVEEFGIPKDCANGGTALKHIYIRYLDTFERVNYHGENPNKLSTADDDEGPIRKKAYTMLQTVPMSYNYAHHHIPFVSRDFYSLSTDLSSITEYDKVTKALLSGMPNEVDFAMNVCTLLSNEGKHVIKLWKSPVLLDILLAQVGIFATSDSSFVDLYTSTRKKHKKRDFIQFWHDCVEEEMRYLILPDSMEYHHKEFVGWEFLHLGEDIGINAAEGQRVIQVAVILRNLTFEEDNCKYMAKNAVVLRFFMLCAHCKHGCLKQLGLEALGNLALQTTFKSLANWQTQLILKTVSTCLSSKDKFNVVRGLEILSKLCQVDDNEDTLVESLQEQAYSDIIQLLTVPDIQLIVYTLEALYQLSELGEETTTHIARVHYAVDILVQLITVEAQSFGPQSLVGIKVVEFLGATSRTDAMQQAANPAVPTSVPVPPPATVQTPSRAPQTVKPARVLVPPTVPQSNTDSETFACNWLNSNYELLDGSEVTQLSLFSEYLNFCGRIPVKNTVSSATFVSCVRNVFSKADHQTVEKDAGNKEVVIKGVGRRSLPLPITIPSNVMSSPVRNDSPHPTSQPLPPSSLRQRLAAPPKISTNGPAAGTTPVTSRVPPAPASSPGLPSHQSAPMSPTSSLPSPTGSESFIQSPTQATTPARAPSPNSHGKRGKPQRIFPAKSAAKNLDTGTKKSTMIKTLLAKKLSTNMVRHNQTYQASEHAPTLNGSASSSPLPSPTSPHASGQPTYSPTSQYQHSPNSLQNGTNFNYSQQNAQGTNAMSSPYHRAESPYNNSGSSQVTKDSANSSPHHQNSALSHSASSIAPGLIPSPFYPLTSQSPSFQNSPPHPPSSQSPLYPTPQQQSSSLAIAHNVGYPAQGSEATHVRQGANETLIERVENEAVHKQVELAVKQEIMNGGISQQHVEKLDPKGPTAGSIIMEANRNGPITNGPIGVNGAIEDDEGDDNDDMLSNDTNPADLRPDTPVTDEAAMLTSDSVSEHSATDDLNPDQIPSTLVHQNSTESLPERSYVNSMDEAAMAVSFIPFDRSASSSPIITNYPICEDGSAVYYEEEQMDTQVVPQEEIENGDKLHNNVDHLVGGGIDSKMNDESDSNLEGKVTLSEVNCADVKEEVNQIGEAKSELMKKVSDSLPLVNGFLDENVKDSIKTEIYSVTNGDLDRKNIEKKSKLNSFFHKSVKSLQQKNGVINDIINHMGNTDSDCIDQERLADRLVSECGEFIDNVVNSPDQNSTIPTTDQRVPVNGTIVKSEYDSTNLTNDPKMCETAPSHCDSSNKVSMHVKMEVGEEPPGGETSVSSPGHATLDIDSSGPDILSQALLLSDTGQLSPMSEKSDLTVSDIVNQAPGVNILDTALQSAGLNSLDDQDSMSPTLSGPNLGVLPGQTTFIKGPDGTLYAASSNPMPAIIVKPYQPVVNQIIITGTPMDTNKVCYVFPSNTSAMKPQMVIQQTLRPQTILIKPALTPDRTGTNKPLLPNIVTNIADITPVTPHSKLSPKKKKVPTATLR